MPLDDTGFPVIELEKIDAMIELLRDERHWIKRSLKDGRGGYCLVGAMQHVDGYRLLEPHIRYAIREITSEQWYSIESFNDHMTTNHQRVMTMLCQVKGNIINRVSPTRVGWLTRVWRKVVGVE